jgi:beta-barrel assembly-enhancing protease
MKSWFATWFDTHGSDPMEATILASETKITIGLRKNESVVTFEWKTIDLDVNFDSSLQATRISHKAGKGQLVVEGRDPIDFFQRIREEQNKAWHKKDRTKEWGRNLGIFFSVIALLALAYVLVVPWLSEKMAGNVSISSEKQLGDAVYGAMDLSANQDPRASAIINEFFAELKIPTAYSIQITVVKGDIVNAFALPGGHIVVYTALLNEIESYPELAALLSHEFTHVNNQHSTRSIFRRLGSRIFISLLLGKFGNVTSIIVDQADQFKSLTYSRKLEKEADLEGLALLKERQIDPAGFVALFEHLRSGGNGTSIPEFLGSHPDISKRIIYIREASANAAIREHAGLQQIFNKLKSIEP